MLTADVGDSADLGLRIQTIVGLVSLAILLQATNMFTALAGTRLVQQVRPMHGLFTSAVLGYVAYATYQYFMGSGDSQILWYGREFEPRDYTTTSLMMFAMWASFGLYR